MLEYSAELKDTRIVGTNTCPDGGKHNSTGQAIVECEGSRGRGASTLAGGKQVTPPTLTAWQGGGQGVPTAEL